ncbi:MAG: thiamine pyrophosphate-dependent enzyme [Flavobacteriaceae bacterium]|nr:thiamine pyrophosphate-dependent enzyme [Flavobacteriaceae bacterium]
MKFFRKKISNKKLLDLYKSIVLPRKIEEKMLLLLRQGKVSKWFGGIGQEAISVGITSALKDDEYVLPMHRNLGVFTTRKIKLKNLFGQWQGKPIGFTNGRDRSFHFGSKEFKIIGMISHLGPQFGIANGIALASKIKKEKSVCVVFTGEGGTSEGDFHEALNVASIWELPVLFCIENNGYGLSTPTKEQFVLKNISDRGAAYSMESHTIDGNNILDVYLKVDEIFKSQRINPRPVLIEFKTFRIRGHEEASGTSYVPQELMNKWKLKDPILNYKEFLIKEGVLNQIKIKEIDLKIQSDIQSAWDSAKNSSEVYSDEKNELNDVYSVFQNKKTKPSEDKVNKRFVDAISEAHREAMSLNDDLVIMGQDIGEYGGVFKITEGLLKEFGKDRVRNTPICESIIVSTAYGLAIKGHKSIVEMQFADFVSSGFTPVVNLLAKSYYRWGQTADIVIRMPCGGGVGAGPFHSQSNESWFTTVPGLKVAYPAFPYEAKGLLHMAIDDPNPILFFEHKKLYRSIEEAIPKEKYCIEFGKAKVRKEGSELVIISYGLGVHWALEEASKYHEGKICVVDLNTLVPWDQNMVFEMVKKCNKVILLQEDSSFGGYMGEISAQIAEKCFEYLDAPIVKVGSLDTPIPFASKLESQYLPKERLKDKIIEVLNY